ncbi:MAG: 5'/3'-nucleotidase SurE [Armatimonadetes bacterium]|nr:5'/3'-nucleotidase SurE [Armatimonadota bacterium]
MRILITNDDGVYAPGIAALVRAVQPIASEIIVSAPDRERSACGHAMTLRDPLRFKETEVEGCRALEVNGVPVDCVNLALTVAFPDGCDLVLSGINNGPNLGFDVTYSGTVAGAMEGCINGIKSMAFSMALFVDGAPLHMETGERWIAENIQKLTEIDLPELTFLNVNVPAIAHAEIEGVRVVGMGQRVYQDRVEHREDPWGRTYYWQGGSVVMKPDVPDTDVWAVSEHYVSVTPVSLDWTNHTFKDEVASRF